MDLYLELEVAFRTFSKPGSLVRLEFKQDQTGHEQSNLLALHK